MDGRCPVGDAGNTASAPKRQRSRAPLWPPILQGLFDDSYGFYPGQVLIGPAKIFSSVQAARRGPCSAPRASSAGGRRGKEKAREWEALALPPSLLAREGATLRTAARAERGGRWPVAGTLGPSGGEEASVTSGSALNHDEDLPLWRTVMKAGRCSSLDWGPVPPLPRCRL